MNREEAIRLLTGGPAGVNEWNAVDWNERRESDLSGANVGESEVRVTDGRWEKTPRKIEHAQQDSNLRPTD